MRTSIGPRDVGTVREAGICARIVPNVYFSHRPRATFSTIGVNDIAGRKLGEGNGGGDDEGRELHDEVGVCLIWVNGFEIDVK
jgi:hypothetical protein